MLNQQDKFTERAKKALKLAQADASYALQRQIEPEYLLLGLLREGGGIASRVLQESGLTPSPIHELARSRPQLQGCVQFGLSKDSKKVIEAAVTNARALRHDYLGTEHLLLGLLDTQPSLFGRLKLDPVAVRQQVQQILNTATSTVKYAGRPNPLRRLVNRLRGH